MVFYFDADGSFKDELQELETSGIHVIQVAQNYFELKYQLEMDLQGKEVFLYHPFAKPNELEIKKYPLLDLLKANHELRLDFISEFISEAFHPLRLDYFQKLKKQISEIANEIAIRNKRFLL